MPVRTDGFYPGQLYHIYNRGAHKHPIFSTEDHYRLLLSYVHRYRQKYDIGVIAHTFMPNHYHFVLREEGSVSISKFISTLFNAYVQAFNKREKHQGTLFEGRFKHVAVPDASHLQALLPYIHLNPVDARLVKRPGDWEFSDYREWVREGKYQSERIKRYRREFDFPSAENYRTAVEASLMMKPKTTSRRWGDLREVLF